MENISVSDAKPETNDNISGFIPVINVSMESEKKNQLLDDSINNAKSKVKGEVASSVNPEEIFQLRGHYVTSSLSGMYIQGVQYFDFKNVNFINNTGIANLIDILKDLLKQGIEVKFVNVKENIKNKFMSMGLDTIFHFS